MTLILSDMELILSRIREKKEDYSRYRFSEIESNALKTFFDLAQEYDTLHNLYRVCVGILKEYFDLESKLYLIDSQNNLKLVCSTEKDLSFNESDIKSEIRIQDHPYASGASYIIPIKGNRLLVEKLPFYAKGQLIGMLEVHPAAALTENDKFFMQKYANRVGYNLNQKIIWQQNIDHITFINNLVADIEHNVITPNIYYKLFFMKLRNKLAECDTIYKELNRCDSGDQNAEPSELLKGLAKLISEIGKSSEEIYKHYENTSLFLETLFRRGHFEHGQWVLRKKYINMMKEIISPQLDRYRKRLEEKGIAIVNNMMEDNEDILLNVDVGLMAQVYANFFSNAEKYTQEARNEAGNKIKLLSFSREVVSDNVEQKKCRIKFNVFTTGPHLSPEDGARLFDEGYRGANASTQAGTGHGLHFVKNVIEVHGGKVGYEPVPDGNNFYFILPC